MAWDITSFQTARGEYPVEQFIADQDERTHAKILHAILLLKDKGPFLKPPFSKKLQSSLHELRITGTVAVRIFYTPHKNSYVLLHAFKKKTQQTPRKELQTAVDRMHEII